MNLSLKYRIYLFPLLVGILVVGSAWFVVIPLSRKLYTEKSKVEEVEVRAGALEAKSKLLTGLDLAGLRDKLSLVRRAVPNQKDPLLYLSVIREVAARSGVVLTSLKSSPGDLADEATSSARPVKKDESERVVFNVGIEGTADQTMEFLKTIRGVLPILKVSKFSYVLRDNGFYSVTCEIVGYYRFLKLDSGPVDLPIEDISAQESSLFGKISGLRELEINPVSIASGSGEIRLNPFGD